MILEANASKKIDEQILTFDLKSGGCAETGIAYLLVPIKAELLRLRRSALLIRQRKIQNLFELENKAYDDELRKVGRCVFLQSEYM